MPSHLITPTDLTGLAVRVRTLVEGLHTGEHGAIRRSHGQRGAEFFDYRPYTPGDDPALVDWKLYGRTDRYHVRRTLRMGRLIVTVLVDATASMAFSGGEWADETPGRLRQRRRDDRPSKYACAAALAGAVALLAVRQGDRAGLGLYTDRITTRLEPAASWAQFEQFCAVLENAQPSDAGNEPGDIAAALRQAAGLQAARGLVILLGDFLDPVEGLLDGLGALRRRGADVVAMQILTPEELELHIAPNLGDSRRLQFIDPETRTTVTTDAASVREDYRAAVRAHIDRIRQGCGTLGVRHELVRTDKLLISPLRRVFGK